MALLWVLLGALAGFALGRVPRTAWGRLRLGRGSSGEPAAEFFRVRTPPENPVARRKA